MNTESPTTDRIQAVIEPALWDLLADYVVRRRLEFTTLPETVSGGDFSTAQIIGHKIAGNASLFGLPQLGELGAELQTAAEEKNLDLIVQLSAKMLNLLNQTDFIIRK